MRFSEKCAFSICLGIRKSTEHNLESEKKLFVRKERGASGPPLRQQRVKTNLHPISHRFEDTAEINVKKTFQFITQCKGDISHAFKTAKIIVFYPMMCKSPDVPLQDELLC